VAHKQGEEKVHYVGDSRVRVKSERPIPQDYTAYPGKSEAFVPNFLLKEWMVGAVVLVGFMVLVLTHPAPLGYLADPLNPNFIPMPDWYFLFMYQILKYPYTSENFIVIGTIIIPTFAFGALLLAPFLDTSKERRFYRRPIASTLMIFSIITVFYLTITAWNFYQHELVERGITPEHFIKEEEVMAMKGKPPAPPKADPKSLAIVAEDDAGATIYQKATCVTCHGDSLKGSGSIPALRGIGDVHSKEELLAIITDGKGGMAPQLEANLEKGLTTEDIDTLAGWLALQKAPVE
jgi:menaquinol-cytochrome c reductase cytochrome b/c subunit